MKSNCRGCGKEIEMNQKAYEIGLDIWQGNLRAYNVVLLVCNKCFNLSVGTMLYEREKDRLSNRI